MTTPATTRQYKMEKNNNNAPEEPKANILIVTKNYEVPLSSLRLGLVLANSVVLLSSLVTLFAWLDLREELVLGAGRLVAESAGVMVTAVHTYLDQLLFLTALNLLLYWALHGVVLAARAGPGVKFWVVLIAVPHTLAVILWEVGCAATIVRMVAELPGAGEIGEMDRYFQRWGPLLAVTYLAAVPVQLVTAGLPLCLARTGEEEPSAHPWDLERAAHARAGEATKKAEADYVAEEKVAGTGPKDLAFYITEMPAEKLAKAAMGKAMRSPPALRGPGSSTAALTGDMMEGVYQDVGECTEEQGGADYLDMQECRLELEGRTAVCSLGPGTPPPTYSSLLGLQH